MLVVGVLLGGACLPEAHANTPLSKAEYSRLRQEINWLMSQYVQEVENGRIDSSRAKGLRYKFMLLWNVKPMTDAGGTAYFLNEVAGDRIDDLAFTIANERAENRLTPRYESNLITRINRIIMLPEKLYLRRLPEVLVRGQSAVVYQKTRISRQKVADAIRNGAPVKEVVAEAEVEWDKWEKRAGATNLSKVNLYVDLNRAIEARLTEEVRAKLEFEPENIQIRTELARMKKLSDDEMVHLRKYVYVYGLRLDESASALLVSQLSSGKESIKSQGLEQEFKRLFESSPYWQSYYATCLNNAATREREEIERKLIPLIVAKKEDSIDGKFLQERLDKLASINPDYAATPYNGNLIDYSLFYAWKGRAHEVAYRLLDAQENAPEKVADLTNDLERFAKLAQIPPKSFLEWAKIRRDAGQPMLTVDMYVITPNVLPNRGIRTSN